MTCSTVSILSANYNNSKYLVEFFDSILNSSYLPEQVVFVDDASTDESLDIVARYTDRLNIKLVKLSENVGFANALNTGLGYVECDYVLRVDPDDIIKHDRVLKQKEFLDLNKHIDIVGSNVSYFLATPSNMLNESNFPTSHEDILANYKKGEHGLIHGASMLRKYCFDEHHYIQENVPSEEYDIFSRMLKTGYIAENLSDSLTMVRIHSGSVTNSIPYSTVAKYHQLREMIWGRRTPVLKVYLEFFAKRVYRRYLFSNSFAKPFFLLLLCVLKPVSLLNRIKQYVKFFG
ncbi:glycosyltransferase [Vibrio sp. 10N.222.51.E8]|uniref:glycosyltransferase n=1 Tax=unclassified Vibrio TaxID=2614977 RepID=UPI0010BDBB0F|nr:glycosyltransferase [Vibrio sp. F13]TKG30323.1 glycosyltransferase [Vibrio sp. F13]